MFKTPEEKLWKACRDGKIQKVQELLQNSKINTNWQDPKYSMTPFYNACYEGHVEIVDLLLNDERVDVNKGNKNGASPFFIACQKGYTETVKLLLNDNRIDINKGNQFGWTPFRIAFENGHTEVISVLRNKKNKLNLKEEVERYNQNLQQNKDIVNSIGNLRDILVYFPESITLETRGN